MTCASMVAGLLLVLMGAGCSTSGEPAAIKTIDRQDFKLLQTARRKLTYLGSDLATASGTALVNERKAKVDAAFAKYSKVFPRIDLSKLTTQATGKYGNSLAGKLLELMRQRVSWKPKGAHERSDTTAASRVALMYLPAIENLYNIKDFEDYLAEHTLVDGYSQNPANPPVPPGPFEKKIGVTISFEPGTGSVVYLLKDDLASDAQPASVYTIAYSIMNNSKQWASDGDQRMVESYRP